MECIDATQKAYAAAGAADKFEFLIDEKTAHRVNPDARRRVIEWFVRWLHTQGS
jgi:hypothetical protein